MIFGCLCIFLQIFAGAAADFAPYGLPIDQVRARVADPRPVPLRDYLDALKIEAERPGLRIAGAKHEGEPRALDRLLRALGPRNDVSFLLAARLHAQTTPTFSGLTLDHAGDPFANFTIVIQEAGESADHLVTRVMAAAEQIDRAANHPAYFEEVALLRLRDAFAYRSGAQIDQFLITSSRLRNVAKRIIDRMRQVRRIYANGLPTWLLIDVRQETSVSSGDVDRLAHLTLRRTRHLNRVFLLRADGLSVIEDGVFQTYAWDAVCALDLRASA